MDPKIEISSLNIVLESIIGTLKANQENVEELNDGGDDECEISEQNINAITLCGVLKHNIQILEVESRLKDSVIEELRKDIRQFKKDSDQAAAVSLPPLPSPDRTMHQYGKKIDHFTAEQMQAYAREALAAQAASVEPVASVLYLSDTGLCSEISEELPWGMALYAGATLSPASVPGDVLERFEALWSGLSEDNRKLVSDHVKHTMPSPAQCAMPEACPDHCHEVYGEHVAASNSMVLLTPAQYNQIPELCHIRPSLYESVVRAIEAASAKINGLTVGK